MDKLKPVLTHKFWILAGLALILPVVGWFLGTGSLAAAIDARVAAINGLNPENGATTPNDSWIAKVEVVSKDREQKLDTAADYLWKQQQAHMQWRPSMRRWVEDLKFEDEIDIQGINTYRRIFGDEVVETLRQIVDPYDPNEMTMRYEGTTVLEPGVLPLTDPQQWKGTPPSSKEIWYLQEDSWLLGSLLDSVREINERAGAQGNITKAPIRQIDSIELRGGNRAILNGEMDPSMMEGGEHGDMGGGMDMTGAMGALGGAFGGMGAGMGEGMAGTLDFSMDEEVGSNAPVATGLDGEMGAEEALEMGGMDMTGAMGALGGAFGGMGGGMGGVGGAAMLLTEKRYVDDDPTLPYKTRAFKMTVLMDHRQLPEFLVALTNSPFPVNIVRVHYSEANPSSLYASTGGYGSSYGSGEEYDMPDMGGARSGGFGGGLGRRPTMTPPSRGMPGRAGPLGGLGGRMTPPMGGRMTPPMGGMNPRMGVGRGMTGPGGGHSGTGMMRSRPTLGSGMVGSEMSEGMYDGGIGGQTGTDNAYALAMSDPYLAQVVVGGVMTIYRSPEEVAAGEAAAAEEAAAGEAAGDAAAPVEGAAPVDDVAPADGTAPPDAASPTEPEPAGAAPGAATGDAATFGAESSADPAAGIDPATDPTAVPDAVAPPAEPDASAEPEPPAADDPAAPPP